MTDSAAQKGTGYASLWALVYVSIPMCYRPPRGAGGGEQ
jgi:hypothetical protein